MATYCSRSDCKAGALAQKQAETTTKLLGNPFCPEHAAEESAKSAEAGMSPRDKVIAYLHRENFKDAEKDFFKLEDGSGIAVDLRGFGHVVGVIINGKLEEEGHGVSRVPDIRNTIDGLLKKKKESPAPKPDHKIPVAVHQNNNKRETMEPKETLPAIVNPEGFLSPVTSIEDALAAFGLFEKAKTQLLNEKDVMWIGANGRPTKKGEGHPHIRRSGWRKMARFFGISCSIASSEKTTSVDSEGNLYIWKYRAIAQKGASSFEAEGVCSSRDPFFSKRNGIRIDPDEGDIMLKAQTVAFNRAISDLLGSGEVSADEIKPEEAKS